MVIFHAYRHKLENTKWCSDKAVNEICVGLLNIVAIVVVKAIFESYC